MPLIAQNAVPIGRSFTEASTFRWPYGPPGARKISGYVNATDVVVQILEEPGGFAQDQTQEVLLREGFNSRDFPPFIACRFRVWDNTQLAANGTIDIAILSE